MREKRIICFDFIDNALFIMNNGPKIEERDQRYIMERGFSRKPEGRGLGLFISSKALESEDMTLVVGSPRPPYNAVFQIVLPIHDGDQ